MVTNSSAPEGKEAKYARFEYERRFLLSSPPTEGIVRRIQMHDRYVSGTRMRVRQAVTTVSGADSNVVHKLTQKIPRPDGRPGLLTTMYLNENEYETLARLPAAELRKARLSVPPLGIDCFEGDLQGLCLAEAEFETQAELEAFVPPPWIADEVTGDDRFTGGHLVPTTRDALRECLAEYGLALTD